MGGKYIAKIGDLGLCERIKDTLKDPKGTPLIMAPELLNHQQYDHSADLYSYGIMLWEVSCEIGRASCRERV